VNPLELLEDPLRGLLDFLHDNAALTYGWSIVVLTVIVRMALLPLVIKQYKSMRRMQAVAPQLKELQRKHKGNRQKLNEELMAFYKENEINPFSSCLPLVAQIPIFIALYYVLRDFAKEAVGAGTDVAFMWVIPDVRQELQDIGWGAGVIVAIYALSQLLSTELSATPNMPDAQRRLMRVLPIVVVVFVFQFPVPSGLVLYWMTTNLWTAGQQLVMRHIIGLHLAKPEEIAKYQPKRGSRTPPKPEPATALVDGESELEPEPEPEVRTTPRKRRRRGAPAGEEAAVSGGADGAGPSGEVVDAQEATDAPPATDAPEAREAPEATEAPEPAEAPEAPADEPEPATTRSSGPERPPSGARRRQPRPKGTAKGSRPAGKRSKKKR